MTIILAIIDGLKRAPECIKMPHFEGKHTTISPAQTLPRRRLPCFHSSAFGALDPRTTFLDTGLQITHYSNFKTSEIYTRLPTVGDQTFPVATARVWDSLPDHVTFALSVAVFPSRLKTHLFNISYSFLLSLHSACAVILVALDTIIVLAYLFTNYTDYSHRLTGGACCIARRHRI